MVEDMALGFGGVGFTQQLSAVQGAQLNTCSSFQIGIEVSLQSSDVVAPKQQQKLVVTRRHSNQTSCPSLAAPHSRRPPTSEPLLAAPPIHDS